MRAALARHSSDVRVGAAVLAGSTMVQDLLRRQISEASTPDLELMLVSDSALAISDRWHHLVRAELEQRGGAR